MRLVKLDHFGAGLAQQFQIAPIHFRRTDPVEQYMHGDAFTRLIGKRARNLLADLAGPVNERFKCDGFARRPNTFEHRRKDLVTVEQHLEAITRHHGWTEQ
ncbi:hypothetical protein QF000_003873 [Paraburkholderia atlantica]